MSGDEYHDTNPFRNASNDLAERWDRMVLALETKTDEGERLNAENHYLRAEKDRLETELAYTSVATVLGRLHTKGLVERTESGRAFAYRAAIDESQLAVRRIGAVLESAPDKAQVLAGFVGTLSKKDIKALRALLGEERA